MFALTQDKLKIVIDKATFYLIVSILNMNTSSGNIFSALINDPTALLSSPPSSSIQSSKSTSPSQLPLVNLNVNTESSAKSVCEIDYDESDDIVYKRIYERCRIVFHQLISSMQEDKEDDDSKTNSKSDDSEDHECRVFFCSSRLLFFPTR